MIFTSTDRLMNINNDLAPLSGFSSEVGVANSEIYLVDGCKL